MKNLKIALLLMLSISIISCSDDDDSSENLSGQTGNLIIKFDNGYGDQDFIFGTEYQKSNDESFKLETLKYIVSNISLEDEIGNVYEYPFNENIFIVDEANANAAGEIWIMLEGIPAANYTNVSFGVGVDQDRYAMGAEGQGEFLETADEAGMLWSWATGFKFIRMDGSFSSSSITNDDLNVHMGSVGTSLDNYRAVSLSFPNTVLVRTETQPEIHIKSDISKVFDGSTSVNLMDGYNQVHVDPETTAVVANNIMTMFEVHHVHNN